MEAMQTPEAWCHDTRKQIDAIIKRVGMAKPSFTKGGREVALVYTKLQEAKMWTGKILEELGSELPKEFQDKAE
jgi:hypothetical protein